MSNFSIPNRPAGSATRHIADIEADFDYVTGGMDSITSDRKLLWSNSSGITGGAVNNTWLMSSIGNFYNPGSLNAPIEILYLDSSVWTVIAGKSPRLFMEMEIAQGATPSVNFTLALYAAAFSAGSGSQTNVALGMQVSGSPVTLAATSPGVSARVDGSAVPFTFPTAGPYVPAVSNSAPTAVSTYTLIHSKLWLMYV